MRMAKFIEHVIELVWDSFGDSEFTLGEYQEAIGENTETPHRGYAKKNPTVSSLWKRGILTRVSPGVYRLSDKEVRRYRP